MMEIETCKVSKTEDDKSSYPKTNEGSLQVFRYGDRCDVLLDYNDLIGWLHKWHDKKVRITVEEAEG